MIDSRPGDAFQPGDLVNNTYRIESLLGRGGTSDVYKARSEISGRLVALKVLKAEFSGNDDYLVLLTREEGIREVRHDAVVRYSENHRTEHGLVYLVMDYVEGPALDRKLKQGPMPADEILTVCRRVAEGLQAAHDRNIVHRDLSPDNIILRDGDPAQAVIIDFGIAKDTNPGAETIVGNEFAGKYAYAAPEQLSGNTDARTDIYSLGALLLANFRGASPDIGNSPMEVVTRKAEPLNTEGVPEPLKTLIDRMTAPEPENRMQSAAEVLAFLDAPDAAPPAAPSDGGADPDATVIVPRARNADAPAATVAPAPDPRDKPAPASRGETRSRGGLFAMLAVVVLIAAGAGAWFSGALDGLLGPKYPIADPYTLIAEKRDGDGVNLTGHAPSEDALAALAGFAETGLGTSELQLASGDIPDSWGADVLALLRDMDGLNAWRVVVDGSSVDITGSTADKALQERLSAALASGLPGALTGRAEITLVPQFLAPDEVQAELDGLADCGPLTLPGVPQLGYGPQSAITVTGKVAGTATRVQLFDGLRDLAGDRNVVVDVEVLNPTLCLIESHLPTAPAGGIAIGFTVGDRDEPNPSGRFFVGENPVIDLTLPADVTDGYLSVSILDVSGNVFHLLPNINRQDNAVAGLRGGRDGDVTVRVAYPVADAGPGQIAFTVDDSTLGKSKILVLHSTAPLFDGMRPTSESAKGYAEALQAHAGVNGTRILSLDSRILETAKP
ncbi:serine/threonine protein kinase [Pukyongiella litopenaei]|uniref:Protein kinase n=1 Tax=Pukyongiella litopenaei TaxID=2605946 RepID=A0A2S0MP82_9RHOB|nr:serine/threonine protein kinase [Pukyongiella litopenaei]AVO37674.1 protein kinase [Pukyongiella litopenaei]